MRTSKSLSNLRHLKDRLDIKKSNSYNESLPILNDSPEIRNDNIEVQEEKIIKYERNYCLLIKNFLVKNKKNFRKLLTLMFQVLLHITLLSLLEPIFFFEYANKIETRVFTDQLSKYFKNDIFAERFIINKDKIFYPLLIKKIEGNKDNFLNKYLEIEKDGRKGFLERMHHNFILESQAYQMFAVLFGSMFILFFFTYIFEKLRYKIIFLEHFFLIFFIGVYEYWFFKNILLNFIPLSTEEINKMFFTCIFNNLLKNNEELKYLSGNNTIQCFMP